MCSSKKLRLHSTACWTGSRIAAKGARESVKLDLKVGFRTGRYLSSMSWRACRGRSALPSKKPRLLQFTGFVQY